jgi:alginate O-acetyltransferase complex protein AlgJ
MDNTFSQPTSRPKIIIGAGVFMLLFLGAGFALTLFTPKVFQAPERQTFLDGKWAVAYEAAFNKNLPLRQIGVATWGVLEYSLFKNGRPGVLVGEDGWLFTSEEFKGYPDGDKAVQEKLELATTAQKTLATFGSKLMVVIIPSKARIYSEQLGRYSLPSYTQEGYETFARELETRNIPVVRLIAGLEAAKTTGDVFLKTDTHWTPYGAEVVAKEMARVIAEMSLLPSLNTATFTTTQSETATVHQGDLLNYIPLGALQERLSPAFDTLQERTTTTEESSDLGGGLFGESTIPVTLVGTSYSANPLWNFEGALKEALGVDVLNVANQGEGPVVPMQEYLASDALGDAPPELVIWEIPERFIRVLYGLQ